MSKNKTTEITLLAPRRVPLHREQAREAVALLSELLLDVAAKRLTSAGAFSCASDSAIGSVVQFPRTRQNGREAA